LLTFKAAVGFIGAAILVLKLATAETLSPSVLA
jgi:hypothetical protein